jgi:hypothetical protein
MSTVPPASGATTAGKPASKPLQLTRAAHAHHARHTTHLLAHAVDVHLCVAARGVLAAVRVGLLRGNERHTQRGSGSAGSSCVAASRAVAGATADADPCTRQCAVWPAARTMSAYDRATSPRPPGAADTRLPPAAAAAAAAACDGVIAPPARSSSSCCLYVSASLVCAAVISSQVRCCSSKSRCGVEGPHNSGKRHVDGGHRRTHAHTLEKQHMCAPGHALHAGSPAKQHSQTHTPLPPAALRRW